MAFRTRLRFPLASSARIKFYFQYDMKHDGESRCTSRNRFSWNLHIFQEDRSPTTFRTCLRYTRVSYQKWKLLAIRFSFTITPFTFAQRCYQKIVLLSLSETVLTRAAHYCGCHSRRHHNSRMFTQPRRHPTHPPQKRGMTDKFGEKISRSFYTSPQSRSFLECLP